MRIQSHSNDARSALSAGEGRAEVDSVGRVRRVVGAAFVAHRRDSLEIVPSVPLSRKRPVCPRPSESKPLPTLPTGRQAAGRRQTGPEAIPNVRDGVMGHPKSFLRTASALPGQSKKRDKVKPRTLGNQRVRHPRAKAGPPKSKAGPPALINRQTVFLQDLNDC
jgi:hypothetical protein